MNIRFQLTLLILPISIALFLGMVLLPDSAYADAESSYAVAKEKLQAFKKNEKQHKYRDKWLRQIKNFERIVEKYPKHKRACDAQYNIGTLYRELSEVSLADKDRKASAGAFEKLVKICPKNSLADDGYYHAAVMHGRVDNTHSARQDLSRCITRHPKGDMRPKCEALLKELGGELPEEEPEPPKSSGTSTILAPSEGPIQLFAAEVDATEGETHLKLTFSRMAAMTQGEIPAVSGSPRRLYYDFANTKISPTIRTRLQAEDPRVSAIRMGQYKETTVRIVFELTDAAGGYGLSNTLQPPTTTIIIRSKPGARTAVATPVRSGPLREDQQESEDIGALIEDKTEKKPAPKPPAAKPPRLAEVRTVVIDAGHGGDDHGATGPTGKREKDIVLKIAKKLKAILEKEQKLRVVLTRKDDKPLGLFDRTKIANDIGADLFISIHANANRRRKFTGFETFYLNNSSDSYSTRLAQRENEVFGKDISDLDFILTDLSMNANIDDSIMLANMIQKASVRKLRKHYKYITDRGVRRAVFHVLLYARMPAVLVETSFISNPREEKRLANSKYQEYLAHGIANGVKAYRDKLSKMQVKR